MVRSAQIPLSKQARLEAPGIRRVTLADLALLVACGDDILGPCLDAYAKKAFTLATGLTIDWQADRTIQSLTALRRIAD